MNLFKEQIEQLNIWIESLYLKHEFLAQNRDTITEMWPAGLQLLLILIVLAIVWEIKGLRRLVNIPRHPTLEEFIQENFSTIGWIVGFTITRVILSFMDVNSDYLDIAGIIATALLVPKALLKLTTLEKSRRHYVTITIWAVLALMGTDKIGPMIAFLDGAKFNLGSVELSLWTVMQAIGLLVLMLWGVKTLTSMLERMLTSSGHISPSARTLISKMANIFGIVVAFLITLDMFGIDLSVFAFFGGALGIGLGFGLQKIVSNFISGIILIMDKSIKPGDVISVGDSYGMVEALYARYVVMRRRDGTEVLVPNESLMTSEVINWSYTNRKVRTKIKVGVSYDSDMEQVQEILQTIVNDHSRVLTAPPARAFITEFADNSVNFELRFWIVDPEEGIGSIRSELFMEIWKTFKKHGIEIPFPQRVLHMKSEKDGKSTTLSVLTDPSDV